MKIKLLWLFVCSAMLACATNVVRLDWGASPSPGVAGYNAYRATVPGGPYTRLNSALITGTTYTDAAVSACVTYYYVATSVTTTGAESAYSIQTSASIPCGLIVSFTASPGSITSGDPSTLSWTTTATGVSINQGVGVVTAPSGTTPVTPTATTIYTLTATLGSVSQTAQATVNVAASTVGTHYVSSISGSDSNDGLSPDRPWRSMGKVNGSSFYPDNRILFKAGEGWSGATLITHDSGTSGHQIIYGSYGSGAKPVIDGGGSLATCVSVTKNYITLNGLAIRNCATLISGPGVAGTQVLNVEMRNGSVWGYRAATGLGTTLVDHTTYTIDPGVHMQAWAFDLGAATSSTSITLTNNTCNVTQAASGDAPGCMEVFATSNALMQYNVSHGGQQALSIKPNGVTVTGGRIIDNYADQVISGSGGDGEVIELEGSSANPQSGVTVARNVLVCNPASANGNTDLIGVFQSNSNFIYGNVLLGACNVPSSITSLARMIHLSSSSANNHIHNNTFAGNTSIRPDQVGIEIGSSSGGDFKNNIFDHLGKGIHANSGSGTVSQDYNIFSPSVATPTLGVITNGVNSQTNTDPKFVISSPVSANDVKLQSISPAIGFGATLGTPYDLILGMGGTASPYPVFTQTAPYADGAFGYGAGVGGGPPGSPTISAFTASPATIALGSPSALAWDTTDATNLTIACDGDSGTFAVAGDSGSISVSPAATETCTLTASNDIGSNAASATITVAVPVAPVIESLTASPSSIPADHYSLLEWVVDGADSLSLSDGTNTWDVTAFNMWQVRLRSDTTFTLTATNSVGPATKTVSVDVFTPVGPAAENIRYHQLRQYDRRGDGHEFQMFRGWPEPQPNWIPLYDDKGNVFPAQPRGTDSTVVQMADSTTDFVEGDALVFDSHGRAKDGGAPPGRSADGCGTWRGQVPLGTRDGQNIDFYLDYLPSSPFVILEVNGVVQDPPSEFYLSAEHVRMVYPPKASDTMYIWYFACTGIAAPPPPIPPTPTYDSISLWAAASNASLAAPFGRPALSYSVDGGITWVGSDGLSSSAGGTDIHVFPTGTFAEQSLDFPMSSTITDLSLLRVRVWLVSTLFTGFTLIPPDQLDIYDVSVSGSDGSARATTATIIDTGAFSPAGSGVDNPLLAVDVDSTTPATFARIKRTFYNAFVYGKFIELSGFGD